MKFVENREAKEGVRVKCFTVAAGFSPIFLANSTISAKVKTSGPPI